MERAPTQAQLLRGAIHTLEEVLIPELTSHWAKASATGLLGQLRYALSRDERNSLADQNAELSTCLRELCDAHVGLRALLADVELRGDESWDLRAQAGTLLVHALGAETPEAVAIRERLRPLLVGHVGQDLAETGPMLHAFLASGTLGSGG